MIILSKILKCYNPYGEKHCSISHLKGCRCCIQFLSVRDRKCAFWVQVSTVDCSNVREEKCCHHMKEKKMLRHWFIDHSQMIQIVLYGQRYNARNSANLAVLLLLSQIFWVTKMILFELITCCSMNGAQCTVRAAPGVVWWFNAENRRSVSDRCEIHFKHGRKASFSPAVFRQHIWRCLPNAHICNNTTVLRASTPWRSPRVQPSLSLCPPRRPESVLT